MFEKRIAIIDEIKKSDKTSKIHLELLFDDTIATEYTEMIACFSNWRNARHDFNIYSSLIDVMDGEGEYATPLEELMDSEQKLNSSNSPDKKNLAAFETLCNKYQITYSEANKAEDTKTYNYKDISKRMVLTEHEYKEQKKKLLYLMQNYIKKSISPVDKDD